MTKLTTILQPHKFNIVCFLFLAVSIVLSIRETLDDECSPSADFDPKSKDNSTWKRMIWYCSQLTYVSQILLCLYFGLKLFGITSHRLFLGVAPVCLTVNVLYFKVLMPKKSTYSDELHELNMTSMVPHFLDIVMILPEILTLDRFSLALGGNSIMVGIGYLLIVLINYALRKEWSYDLLKLNTMSGWQWVGIALGGNVVMFIILFILNRLAGN